MRSPSAQDILREAIGAMIMAEVNGVENDCNFWNLSNEDFLFKLNGYGRSYTGTGTKVRVSVGLRGLTFPGDTPRAPSFVAGSVEEAKEKLINKLLPEAKALRERCLEARKYREQRDARIKREYAEAAEKFKGIEGAEVSTNFTGSISVKTVSGVTINITNYKGFWQMSLDAPSGASPEKALELVKILNEV
jgi:hypothetical protein